MLEKRVLQSPEAERAAAGRRRANLPSLSMSWIRRHTWMLD
jgi:hypothetical protein